jgi:hypothetical protein
VDINAREKGQCVNGSGGSGRFQGPSHRRVDERAPRHENGGKVIQASPCRCRWLRQLVEAVDADTDWLVRGWRPRNWL